MHVVNDCLMVPLGVAPEKEAIDALREEVLRQAQEGSLKGVLLDVSAVNLLDSRGFAQLAQMARAISLMGLASVFVGFQAGVAGALIDLGVDTSGIATAINLEDAFEMLAGGPGDQQRDGWLAAPSDETDD